jgi:hypothetical protein
MFKKLLPAFILIFGAALLTSAQDDKPPLREIYKALSYGDEVFEPDLWFASATETVGMTTAQWNAPSISALSYLVYRHFDEGIQPEDVGTYFDNAWFEAAFANYESWRKVGVCYDDDTALHKFNLRLYDTDYAMRYWVEPVSDTRVMAIFIVFPSADVPGLDDYAARLYPDLPDCAR